MNDYYVYVLIDPRSNQPFYVGKGVGDRMYYHERAVVRKYADATKPHHNRIEQILREGFAITYDKILVGVTEGQALNRERELIKQYGRAAKGKGPLLNFAAGGQRGGSLGRQICQYSLDGELIWEFDNIKEASECVPGANRSYITQVAKGKRKSAGGFMWVYKGEAVPKFKKEYYSPVIQFNIKTKKQMNIFRSMTEAQKLTGVELHNISEACRGNSKSAGGYLWMYA